MYSLVNCFFFFKQKTAYEMRISDWSSDVCSSDLQPEFLAGEGRGKARRLLQQHAERPRRQRRLQLAQHQWRGRLSDPAARRAPLRCAGQFLLQMTPPGTRRSEEHTSELQPLMRISYAVFCLKKKKNTRTNTIHTSNNQRH